MVAADCHRKDLMTFKQQVEVEFCQTIAELGRCPDHEGDCIKQFCPKVKEKADRILAAHNAELDRIAEGMPKIHRSFVCDPKKIGEYTNKVIDAQLKADQAYIQAQKGSQGGFMNIDDVLLTMGENEKYFNYGARFPKERDKAQCLKLLEWLKEECKEHYHMQPLYRKSHIRRMACPECISELEAMLREV
jgi:hypothetical protein